jgi:hypothetical protein
VSGRQARRKVTASKKRACEEKRVFSSKKQAQEAASSLMGEEPWRGEKVAYQCQYSGDAPHFHIGAPMGRS